MKPGVTCRPRCCRAGETGSRRDTARTGACFRRDMNASGLRRGAPSRPAFVFQCDFGGRVVRPPFELERDCWSAGRSLGHQIVGREEPSRPSGDRHARRASRRVIASACPVGQSRPMCTRSPALDQLASSKSLSILRPARVPRVPEQDSPPTSASSSPARGRSSSRTRSDATKFSAPKTSSRSSRTWCTFSSQIWTNTLPLGVSRSRATSSRSRR